MEDRGRGQRVDNGKGRRIDVFNIVLSAYW
jgi:hypothetical protein